MPFGIQLENNEHTLGVLVTVICDGLAWIFGLELDLFGEAPLEDGLDLRPFGRKGVML